MSYSVDYAAGGDAAYTGILPGDVTDTIQVAPYVNTSNGQAWWESLIQYGVTKAIDNRLGQQNISGNTAAGSYAGQNGKTYLSNGSGSLNLGTTVAGIPFWVLLLGAGAAAYFAFKG